MNNDIKSKLLNNRSLTSYEVYTIVREHLNLFGTMLGYNPIDRTSIKYFADRVRKFYMNDKDIVETHKKYVKQLAFKPTRTFEQLNAMDCINLTEVESYNLKDEYIKEFTNKEKLNPLSFKDSVLMLDRLTKLKKGDESAVTFKEFMNKI